MAKRVTHKNLGEAVSAREPFVGPSSRGGSPEDVGTGTGYLPSEHAETMRAHNPNYIVKSYNTPVAWHGEKGWVVPDVKYSRTTSRLQSTIRRSVNQHFKDGHDGAKNQGIPLSALEGK